MGNTNKTKSGHNCQAWKEQKPHSHVTPPDVFPQIRFGENHCRNAGGDEHVPWCFTMDINTRWEHCNIPLCGNYCSMKKFKTMIVEYLQIENSKLQRSPYSKPN